MSVTWNLTGRDGDSHVKLMILLEINEVEIVVKLQEHYRKV